MPRQYRGGNIFTGPKRRRERGFASGNDAPGARVPRGNFEDNSETLETLVMDRDANFSLYVLPPQLDSALGRIRGPQERLTLLLFSSRYVCVRL